MGRFAKSRAHFNLEQLKHAVFSPADALDYTEKWLEDTLRCLRDEAEADGSSAASSDLPTFLPLSVHNHAYIRLLKWDHASDPFPEVNNSGSLARYAVPCALFDISSVAPDSLDSSFSVRRRC